MTIFSLEEELEDDGDEATSRVRTELREVADLLSTEDGRDLSDRDSKDL